MPLCVRDVCELCYFPTWRQPPPVHKWTGAHLLCKVAIHVTEGSFTLLVWHVIYLAARKAVAWSQCSGSWFLEDRKYFLIHSTLSNSNSWKPQTLIWNMRSLNYRKFMEKWYEAKYEIAIGITTYTKQFFILSSAQAYLKKGTHKTLVRLKANINIGRIFSNWI